MAVAAPGPGATAIISAAGTHALEKKLSAMTGTSSNLVFDGMLPHGGGGVTCETNNNNKVSSGMKPHFISGTTDTPDGTVLSSNTKRGDDVYFRERVAQLKKDVTALQHGEHILPPTPIIAAGNNVIANNNSACSRVRESSSSSKSKALNSTINTSTDAVQQHPSSSVCRHRCRRHQHQHQPSDYVEFVAGVISDSAKASATNGHSNNCDKNNDPSAACIKSHHSLSDSDIFAAAAAGTSAATVAAAANSGAKRQDGIHSGLHHHDDEDDSVAVHDFEDDMNESSSGVHAADGGKEDDADDHRHHQNHNSKKLAAVSVPRLKTTKRMMITNKSSSSALGNTQSPCNDTQSDPGILDGPPESKHHNAAPQRSDSRSGAMQDDDIDDDDDDDEEDLATSMQSTKLHPLVSSGSSSSAPPIDFVVKPSQDYNNKNDSILEPHNLSFAATTSKSSEVGGGIVIDLRKNNNHDMMDLNNNNDNSLFIDAEEELIINENENAAGDRRNDAEAPVAAEPPNGDPHGGAALYTCSKCLSQQHLNGSEWDHQSVFSCTTGGQSGVSVQLLQDRIQEMQENHFTTNEELQAIYQELTDLQVSYEELVLEKDSLAEDKNILLESLHTQTEKLEACREQVDHFTNLLCAGNNNSDQADLVGSGDCCSLSDSSGVTAPKQSTSSDQSDIVADDAADTTAQWKERERRLVAVVQFMHNEKHQYEEQKRHAQERYDGLKDMLDEVQHALEDVQQQCKSKDRMLLSFKNQVRKHKDRNQQQAEEIRRLMACLTREKDKSKQFIAHKDTTKLLGSLEAIVNKSENERVNAERELNGKCAELEQKTREITKLEDWAASLAKEKVMKEDVYRQEIGVIHQRLRTVEAERDQKVEALRRAQEELAQLKQTERDVQRRLQDLEQRYHDECDEWEAFQNDLLVTVRVANELKSEAQEELEQVQDALQLAQKRYQQLEKELLVKAQQDAAAAAAATAAVAAAATASTSAANAASSSSTTTTMRQNSNNSSANMSQSNNNTNTLMPSSAQNAAAAGLSTSIYSSTNSNSSSSNRQRRSVRALIDTMESAIKMSKVKTAAATVVTVNGAGGASPSPLREAENSNTVAGLNKLVNNSYSSSSSSAANSSASSSSSSSSSSTVCGEDVKSPTTDDADFISDVAVDDNSSDAALPKPPRTSSYDAVTRHNSATAKTTNSDGVGRRYSVDASDTNGISSSSNGPASTKAVKTQETLIMTTSTTRTHNSSGGSNSDPAGIGKRLRMAAADAALNVNLENEKAPKVPSLPSTSVETSKSDNDAVPVLKSTRTLPTVDSSKNASTHVDNSLVSPSSGKTAVANIIVGLTAAAAAASGGGTTVTASGATGRPGIMKTTTVPLSRNDKSVKYSNNTTDLSTATVDVHSLRSKLDLQAQQSRLLSSFTPSVITVNAGGAVGSVNGLKPQSQQSTQQQQAASAATSSSSSLRSAANVVASSMATTPLSSIVSPTHHAAAAAARARRLSNIVDPLRDPLTKLTRGHGSKRNALLKWCQEKTLGYTGVDITNFSTSWSDGLAFCALLASLGLPIPYKTLNGSDKRRNFDVAFKAAASAGIAPMPTAELDLNDLMNSEWPDWRPVFKYVTTIYAKLEGGGAR